MAHSISAHFAALPDPREGQGRLHRLDDMLTVAICGVICGAYSWTEVQQFGEAKRNWFNTFLKLPHGIPSHDTFGQLFASLDPDAFERCFIEWMQALAEDESRIRRGRGAENFFRLRCPSGKLLLPVQLPQAKCPVSAP